MSPITTTFTTALFAYIDAFSRIHNTHVLFSYSKGTYTYGQFVAWRPYGSDPRSRQRHVGTADVATCC